LDTQIERDALDFFRRLLDANPSLDGDIELEITSLTPAVASRVRSMLAALRSKAMDVPSPFARPPITAPTTLGGFALGETLGQGGMGTVFAGEKRQGEVVLQAAVKWLPTAALDSSRRARFVLEQQVVARLSHPGIARLIDAGETAEGGLWYAMERIHGQHIDAFCSTQHLSLAARLKLVAEIAEALAYAHRNLVLHRDIKPSNVLVSAEGRACLIDFGIAKPLADDSTALTREQAPMTLRYASPEQLKQDTLTTRSDLWQLAALAYELITGKPARKHIGSDALSRASSAALECDEAHVASLGLSRQQLCKALRGDIDAVLAKALRQAPEDRYSNVDEFRDDLEAILAGLPVAARRGETWYAGRTFLRRHRLSLGFATVAAVLALGLVWSAFERARQQAEAAERSVALLSDILLQLPEGDEGGDGNSMTVPVLLARANARILDNSQLPPHHRMSLAGQIARRALDLGAQDPALEAARKNLELAESIHGAASIDTAQALDLLAEVNAVGAGDTAQALRLLSRSAAIHAAAPHQETAAFLNHLRTRGWVESQSGDDRALESIRLAAELAGRLPDESPGTHELHLSTYSMFLRSYGHWDKAEEVIDAALRQLDALGAAAPSATVADLESEACIVHSNQATPSAIQICRRRVESIEREGALESLGGSTALLGLAIAQNNLGESADALRTIDQAEAVTLAFEGRNPRSQNMRHIQLARARILKRLQRWDEAALAFEEAIRLFAARDPETSAQRVNRTRVEWLEVLVEAGRTRDARALIEAGIDLGSEDSEYQERYRRAVAGLAE
jgi:tRNA A-37 threonylcarbamoyl transferase component Bud32/tetratricopeptide (TPR) repeat protein